MIGVGPKADRLGLTSRFFNNVVHFLIQNLVLPVAPNSSIEALTGTFAVQGPI